MVPARHQEPRDMCLARHGLGAVPARRPWSELLGRVRTGRVDRKGSGPRWRGWRTRVRSCKKEAGKARDGALLPSPKLITLRPQPQPTWSIQKKPPAPAESLPQKRSWGGNGSPPGRLLCPRCKSSPPAAGALWTEPDPGRGEVRILALTLSLVTLSNYLAS